MKAKVLVRVDREAAVQAIRALDALGDALREHEPHWPKQLKRTYKFARRDLLDTIGYAANFSGIAENAVID